MVGFGLANYQLHIFPLQPDSLGYDSEGWKIAQDLRQGKIIWPGLGPKLYSFIVGLIYSFIGHSYFAMSVINSAFSALTIFNISRLTRNLFNKKAARMAALISIFYVAFYWHGTQNLRDPMIMFAITEVFYLVFLWVDRKKIKYFVYASFFIMPASLLRPGIFILFCLVFGLYMAIIEIRYRKTFLRKVPFFIVFTSLVLIFIYYLPVVEYTQRYINIKYIISAREIRRTSLGTTAGGFVNSWEDVFKTLSFSGFNFLLNPFPWLTSSFQFTRAWVGSSFILLVIILSVSGIKRGFTRENIKVLMVILFFLFGVTFGGIIDIDVGVASRHRMLFIPLIIPFAGLTLSRLKIK